MSLNPRVTDWENRRIWIIGASSGIGHALANLLLQKGARVALSARHTEKLQALANSWPKKAEVLTLDVCDENAWADAYRLLQEKWHGIDHLVFCAADYEAVRAWTLDISRIRQMVNTNLEGPMIAVATVLPDMLAARSGSISIIASVAGYMGLPKSLVYGPTKAALINFCESLYLDVHDKGIAVSVINPGFVDTPLTQKNDFTMPALITPDMAAHEIVRGLEAGDFEIHFPKRFTRWLRLLRHLPYPLRFRVLAKIAEQS